MHADFNERHKVPPWLFSPSSLMSQNTKLMINIAKCPPNAARQVRINSCIYPKVKIMPTFTITVLLEIGGKGLDLKDTSCWMSKNGHTPGHKCT